MQRFSSPNRVTSLLFSTVLLFAASLIFPGALQAQSTTQDQSSTSGQSAAPPSQPPAQSDKKEKKSSDPGTVKLRIEVTSPDGKPVGNASVYVRFNETVGLFHKNKLAEMSLKTNQDGSVKVTDLPQGKILIQVIAKGWHTFGKWYDIETDSETVQIKLEAPPHWY
jgi:protocatechuate 3,4-dioxygenase beta subunit